MSFRNDYTPSAYAVITPSDSAQVRLAGIIYSGGAVKVKNGDGTDETLPAAFAGVVLPGSITMVYLTGTTATSILGFKP
jgi:hypothetical protein